jgi:elongation factor G
MPVTEWPAPPLLSMTVESNTKAGELGLYDALSELASDDPLLSFTIDKVSGEIILHGASEPHLGEAVGELISRGIGVRTSAPRVAYLETLARAVEVDYTHKTQARGSGQFARVKLRLAPREPGLDNEFDTEIVGGTVPQEYIPGVEKGVESIWASGVLVGYPLVATKVTLFDGAFHEVDSSTIAFEIASRQAMREGCQKAGIKLLEPIMNVEVVAPREFVDGVVADLNVIHAHIRATEMRDDNMTVIRANAPLAKLFGYASRLHSRSNGRASHDMVFSHYAVVQRRDAPDPDTFPPAVGMR